MKTLEKQLDVTLTTKYGYIVRLDGKGFSKFTKKNFEKPHDSRLEQIFQNVTESLVKEYFPTLAYTQSDEITLYFDVSNRELYFNGRVQKLVSLLAGKTSTLFMYELYKLNLTSALEDLPCFDARVFEVSNLSEVYESFKFRYFDCLRNSKLNCSMFLPKKERLHKSGSEIVEQVKGTFDYFSLPLSARKGTFYKKVVEPKSFVFDGHEGIVDRRVIKRINLDTFPESEEEFKSHLL